MRAECRVLRRLHKIRKKSFIQTVLYYQYSTFRASCIGINKLKNNEYRSRPQWNFRKPQDVIHSSLIQSVCPNGLHLALFECKVLHCKCKTTLLTHSKGSSSKLTLLFRLVHNISTVVLVSPHCFKHLKLSFKIF
jgi:hypothetical protein